MKWLANLVTSGGYEYHRAKAEDLFGKLEAEKAKNKHVSGLVIQARETLGGITNEFHAAIVKGQNSEARSVKWQKEYDKAFAEAKELRLGISLSQELHKELQESYLELVGKADAWFQETIELKGDRDAWEQSYHEAAAANARQEEAIRMLGDHLQASEYQLQNAVAQGDAWCEQVIGLKSDHDAWVRAFWEMESVNHRQERTVTRLGDRIKVLESDKKTLSNAANNLLAERNELRDALEKTRTELTKAKANDHRGPGGRFVSRQG